MEHTRLKNVAICKRKLPQNLSISELVKAINALDIQIINNETNGVTTKNRVGNTDGTLNSDGV